MPQFLRRSFLGLAAVSLTGCVIAPIPRQAAYPRSYPGYDGPEGYPTVEAPVRPPPPLSEVYGVAPVVGMLWVAGFWNWVGGRHVWVAGRWVQPRRGYRWSPYRWQPYRGRWRLSQGRWERR